MSRTLRGDAHAPVVPADGVARPTLILPPAGPVPTDPTGGTKVDLAHPALADAVRERRQQRVLRPAHACGPSGVVHLNHQPAVHDPNRSGVFGQFSANDVVPMLEKNTQNIRGWRAEGTQQPVQPIGDVPRLAPGAPAAHRATALAEGRSRTAKI